MNLFKKSAKVPDNYRTVQLATNRLTTSERAALGQDLASASHELASEVVAMAQW